MTTTETKKRFGYSIDIGQFVQVGNTVFDEYGGVYDMRTSAFRQSFTPDDYRTKEDYSEWPESKRAQVRAHWEAIWQKNREERDKRRQERRERVAAIEKKLTAEEIETLKTYYGQ